MYISLPGSPSASNPSQYISHRQAANLITAYSCSPQLGGVAIWDATYSEANRYNGYTFHAYLKKHLQNLCEYHDKNGCNVSRT